MKATTRKQACRQADSHLVSVGLIIGGQHILQGELDFLIKRDNITTQVSLRLPEITMKLSKDAPIPLCEIPRVGTEDMNL